MILLWDVKAEEPLDERSRSLLKRLLDETSQRPQQQPIQQSHADPPVLSVAPTAPSDHDAKESPTKVSTPAPPPAVDTATRVEPPQPVETGACHPLLFLAKPPASVSERPTKPKPCTHIRRPRSRCHRTLQMGPLPPPRGPPKKAGDSMRTTAPDAVSSPADRTLARPPAAAAASWAIVPANPPAAPIRQKRSRLETVGPAMETPTGSRLGSESTSAGAVPSDLRTRIKKTDSSDQTAKITKQMEPPDRGSTVSMACSLAKITKQKEPQPPDRGSTVSIAPSHRVRTEPLPNASSAGAVPRDPRTQIKKTESSDQTAKITKQMEPPDRRSTVSIARSSAKITKQKEPPDRRSTVSIARTSAKITKQKEPPDRGSTVSIARSSSERDCRAGAASKRGHRKQMRDPRDQTVRNPPPARPKVHRVSSTHQSRPHQRERSPEWTSSETSGREDPGGAAAKASRFMERSRRRGAIPFRHDPSPSELTVLSERKLPGRPIVAPSRSRAGDSIAMAKAEPREKKAEKKDGRLRRLKNSLGLIFHHHHHHYHHHDPPPSDAGENGGRRRRHRPLRKLLGGIFHHKGGKRGAGGPGQPPPPSKQVQRHGYLHMLLEGLLRRLWRGGAKQRKQRPPRPGGAAGRGAAKKLHWWQRLRRRRRARGLRVGSRTRPLFRLGFGRKATVGGGGSKNKE